MRELYYFFGKFFIFKNHWELYTYHGNYHPIILTDIIPILDTFYKKAIILKI